MNFCSHCGSHKVEYKIPAGDNRYRHVCCDCGFIHYQNPRIICGCLPLWENRILLCKRAIEPRQGYWTLPAGFMENNETTQEAAERETLEEANARIAIDDLYCLFNLPHINQVYFFYRGKLKDTHYSSGTESLEVDLFKPDDIPWDELAFTTVRKTLTYFLKDRSKGNFIFRKEDIRIPSAQ